MHTVKFHFTIYFRLILMFMTGMNAGAQNSMVGDGFGGRLWYNPTNYTVGSYSAYTVCGDSQQLFGWGDNEYYQLGDGTIVSTTIPVKIPGMTEVSYYSTGYLMGAIKKDSSGWLWGTPDCKTPLKVIDQVKFMDAGIKVVIFVKSDGTVWSVGNNSSGSFGNDTLNNYFTKTPCQMVGIRNAVRVSNGEYSSLALLKNGSVMSAGTNEFGALGTGAPPNLIAKTPTLIPGLSNIIDIKSNAFNHIALDKDGKVYAWGKGSYGCIGNGNTADALVPVKISSLKNIVAISGCNDGFHFLALDADHNCYEWGYSNITQIFNTPVKIATDVADIMAGETFSYILKTDGTLWAKGRSKGGSIWLNKSNLTRDTLSLIDPASFTINLCPPKTKCRKYTTQSFVICEGDYVLVAGRRHSLAGIYTDIILSDCDSIITSNIKVVVKPGTFQMHTICRGETISVKGHQYTEEGTYRDTFFRSYGCDSTLTTTIKFNCDYKLFNVFTPNKDNINDIYEIIGPSGLLYDLNIYNRWGVCVFKTENTQIKDRNAFWNGRWMNSGKECPSATYYYIFKPNDQSGKVINGIVELIR